jgi:hypothetical protein
LTDASLSSPLDIAQRGYPRARASHAGWVCETEHTEQTY